MKVLLSVFFFFFMFYGLKAQQDTNVVNWLGLEEAVARQQNEPRKIFMDIYTDWCGWCRRMDAQTFTHPVIVKYLNENFYPVKFNAEQKGPVVFQGISFVNQNPETNRSSHDLAIALLQGKMGYPSIVFIDEESKVITHIPGYKTPEALEPLLYFIHNTLYMNTNWEEFQQTFEGEIR